MNHLYFSDQKNIYKFSYENTLIKMESCQIIFLNLAIVGFISQLFKYILFFNKNLASKKDNARDLLEKIYSKSSSYESYIRNLNF